jgi:Ca2+-transporting ATPase
MVQHDARSTMHARDAPGPDAAGTPQTASPESIRFGSTPPTGLDGAGAAARLRAYGPTELPRPPRRGLVRSLLGVLTEPMYLLLVLAAGIYLAVGGLGEGLLMLAFAGVSIFLVVIQEMRSENALAALRALAAPAARVLRDGREQRIAAREVVPGDLLFIVDGDRIAADAVLRSAQNVSVDESLLTGESVPVAKRVDAEASDADARTVYADTLVTSGRGLAEVVATGRRTEAGKIGASLAAIRVEPTRLQQAFVRLVRLFAAFALAAAILVTVLYGLVHRDWLQATLSGIAIGMSALPEEFPMVLAIFVALGARRLAQLQVLVRRTASIEVLGACSTLCVDKTGTLTENRMRVSALAIDGEFAATGDDDTPLPAPFAALVSIAAAASAHSANEPMDAAVHRLAERWRDAACHSDAAVLVREYGFDQKRPAVVRVWRAPSSQRYAAAKGAPETIAEMCRLDAGAKRRLLDAVEAHAARGARMLAVALAQTVPDELPDDPRAFDLQLCGLVAFADPLRASAREAIRRAREAGVAVAMITGDHPATALAIAREAGIDGAAPVLTGTQIAAADDAALRRLVRTTRVFARVRPEQKLRLVRAFQANGEVVAMFGDGVNDAPALKAADIGLAMGERGTDVAREAAAIVLLKDDLEHLVAGIAMGRRIFDNLRKAALYIAAIHIPICGLAFLPLLLGMPPLLLPMHVVLVEMIIDPTCAIAFEYEPIEPGAMRQPPRRADESLLGVPQFALATVQGLLLLAAAFGVYAAGLQAGMAVDAARTLAFVAFTAGNLALIRVVATRGATLSRLFAAGHAAYWVVAASAVAIVALIVALPGLRGLFRFASLPLDVLLAAVVVGAGSALLFDVAKLSANVQRILGRVSPVSATERGGTP